MNELPPFVYAKAFWNALSYVVAGVLWLLVYFGVIPAQYALAPSAILLIFLSILNFFNIEPELRLRAEVQRLKALLAVKKTK